MFVVVLHSGGAYCRMATSAILVGVCHVLIGATVMPVFMYCLNNNFKDNHVALYVFGFHFFSVEAILFLNFSNGVATPMRLKHRRCAHVILQNFALVCIIAGTVLVYIEKGPSGSPHGMTGVIAATLAICSLLSSPITIYGKDQFKMIHVILGMPAFVVSSISLCLGFNTPDFKKWAGSAVAYMLMSFVSFYTLFIEIKILLKSIQKMRN